MTPPAAVGLRRFLADAWIDHQLAYHERSGDRQWRRERLLSGAVYCLFFGTLVLAVAAVWQSKPENGLLKITLTALPALAAACSGIREQRQYVRNSERSRRVAGRLKRLKARLQAARDLGSVQELASAAGLLLTDENQDWFGVMRPGDLKPTPP